MRFWIFLLAPIFVLANLSTAVLENDPSTLVDGVSVITGDFYLGEEDYSVAGAEPIPLRRFYLSSIGGIHQYPHLTAHFSLAGNKLIAYEPNSTPVIYSADPANKLRGEIGHAFYDKKKRLLRYHSRNFADTSPGMTNTSTGVISAKTQLKNQTIVFDPSLDDKGKSFTLYASDGAVRRYHYFKHQKKSDLGVYGKHYVDYDYKLVSETLPNGRILHYDWDHENRLMSMRTTNPRNSKTLAQLFLPKLDPKKLGQSYSLRGSDGKSVSYIYRQTGKKKSEFAQVISPQQADQYFNYSSDRLSQISLPNGRTIVIQYDGAKVSGLLAPIGPNGSLIPYYKFTFNEGAKTSCCIDALGNKTSYFWNNDYRLTRIDRCEGEQTRKNSETFVWEGTNLRSKVFYDEMGSPLFAKTFAYDPKGNLLAQIFWGNISGRGPPLHIDSNGMPMDDGVEKAIIKNSYEARNLLQTQEEPNGLVTEYTYHPHAQLPTSKTCSANGHVFSKTTYFYDDDHTLIREVVEDGSLVCKIRDIIPRQVDPYIGLPDWILEKYKDNGIERLLKKTQLHYTKGALISQKDLYDAEGTFQYSLYYKYDAKGRILEETNAIGQTAIYDYDEVGNKTYVKDFSGRHEMFFDYDLANRLIKKIVKGFDNIEQEFLYAYDERHNLVTKTDSYGNTTLYEYDLNGQKTKTTSPPQQMQKSDAQSATVRTRCDSMGNPIAQIDAEGHETKTLYNIFGKPIHITYPDGAVEQNCYNIDGTLALHIDPLGIETHYKYDAMGHIIEKRTDDAVELFVYDGSYLIEKTDAEGTKTFYRYDGAGRKVSEEIAGEIVTFTYDFLGRLASRVEEDLATSYQYDLLDRLKEEQKLNQIGKLLQITQYEYDAAGNQSAVIQGKSSTQRFTYDSLNREIRKIDPFDAMETTQYEIVHNSLNQKVLQKTKTDPLGLQTIETFDAQHRLVCLEKRKDRPLLIEHIYYDLNGQKTAQEERIYNPDGSHRTILNQWEYDMRKRLIALIEGNGSKITRYEYNFRSDREAIIKPDGTVLSYRYNSLGHLKHLFSSDQTIDHRLEVDRLGRLKGFDGIARALDAKERILEEKFPSGAIIKNRYERGKKIEYSIPLFDLKIHYHHGPLDLEKVTFQNHTHAYTDYDLSGNLIEEALIGKAGALSHTYDLAQRPLSLQNPYFTQRIEEYDAVGNILRMNLDGVQQTYTYDELYQLLSETGSFCHNYVFDALYNRLSKDSEQYALNDLNQAISHCTYDLNGNVTQIGSLRLFYDALDRLIRIEAPHMTQTFTYDYLNRCLSQTTQGMQPLFFLYDGQNEVGSFDDSLRDFRVLGRTETAEIGAAVAMQIEGSLYTPIHDLQGNVAALIPIDHTPIAKYRYSAFGEEVLKEPPISPWRFSSKRVNALTGFVNYGRRFYVPSMGRWLTPDPLGFTAGMNLYAFVHNDPLTHFDEYGLFSVSSPPPWLESICEKKNRLDVATMHVVGDQVLDTGRFIASAPYYAERGFNYLTGRQNYTTSGWQESQNRLFGYAQDWMYRTIPTDRTHPDYQMYRTGIESCIDFIGGYGLAKGGFQAVKTGFNAWRRTFVAGEKLAMSPKLSARSLLKDGSFVNKEEISRGISVAGSKRTPLKSAPYQKIRNNPTIIQGRSYGGHALDQMQNRGFTPSVVEETIKNGISTPNKVAGRMQFYNAVNNISVITEDGKIVTVMYGRPN